VNSPAWLRADLTRVEDLLLESAGDSLHSLVSDASTHLIRAGGKRIRPALVMLSSRSGDVGRRATDLSAAAIELVHLATLYHDDVIDETETRRGVPTVHSKWGIEVAVLVGDFLFARGCTLGAEAGGEVPGILARAIAEVCEGQIVETVTIGNPRRPVGEYLGTIEQKTAALFRAACELGAATAGSTNAERSALVMYGHKLGLAFQIVDDLLDLVGDPAETGKIPGTDLREGVFTMPVLLACERDGSLAEKLDGGDRDLGTVLPKLEATGVLESTYQTASNLAEDALLALKPIPDSDWRATLEYLVESVLAQIPKEAVA
jgi:heptaprenyl diphosphate synthase